MCVSSVKTINTMHSERIEKQGVVNRQTTASIKVVLWQDCVDGLEFNQTYELENLRVKTCFNEQFLNTAKNEKFLFKETSPFKQPLVDVDEDLSQLTVMTVSSKILGIQQVHRKHFSIS